MSLKPLWCTLSRTGVNWNVRKAGRLQGGKDTYVCPFKIVKLSSKTLCFLTLALCSVISTLWIINVRLPSGAALIFLFGGI